MERTGRIGYPAIMSIGMDIKRSFEINGGRYGSLEILYFWTKPP